MEDRELVASVLLREHSEMKELLRDAATVDGDPTTCGTCFSTPDPSVSTVVPDDPFGVCRPLCFGYRARILLATQQGGVGQCDGTTSEPTTQCPLCALLTNHTPGSMACLEEMMRLVARVIVRVQRAERRSVELEEALSLERAAHEQTSMQYAKAAADRDVARWRVHGQAILHADTLREYYEAMGILKDVAQVPATEKCGSCRGFLDEPSECKAPCPGHRARALIAIHTSDLDVLRKEGGAT